jgi:predicted permease
VGVLPAGFEFPGKAEVWFAAPARLWNLNRTAYNYNVVAKLQAAVSVEQAQARLDTVAARLSAAFPGSNRGKSFAVTPLRDQLVRPVGATLWILMAAVSLVLLIACANVANLLLARAAGRRREIALRAALGASRWRILRQLVVESAILAVAAGILGVLLAAGGTGALLRLAPQNLPRLTEVRVDRFALLFAAAAALLATMVFGLAPAWQTSRIDLREALQSGARGMVGGRSGRLRGALVVAEVSLSAVLAVGAVLLFRSLLALTTIDLGYRTEGRLVMYTHVPAHGRDEYLRVAGSFDRLLPEFAAIPGVQSAAAAMGVPAGRYGSNGSYFVDGEATANPPNAGFLLASSGYFATMGIPLLRGRDFAAFDRYDAPFVAIVNQALVRRSFPNENPVGKRIKCGLDAPDQWLTIVGVVGDVRQNSPASAPEPELYMPLSQHPYHANEFQIVLRAAVSPASLAGPARKRMHDLYPLAATDFTTLEQMVATSIATPRFRVYVTGVFAGLALLLAMIGVYGVMSYLTAHRTSEFGLRLALGARPGELLAGVLAGAARLALAGLSIGALISIACGRLIGSMLFGLEPTDTFTYAAVLGGVLILTLAAAAVPAWRAARIDPASALRSD